MKDTIIITATAALTAGQTSNRYRLQFAGEHKPFHHLLGGKSAFCGPQFPGNFVNEIIDPLIQVQLFAFLREVTDFDSGAHLHRTGIRLQFPCCQVQKGGLSPVVDVLDYGDRLENPCIIQVSSVKSEIEDLIGKSDFLAKEDAFAHIRNVKHFDNGDFSEASHRDCDGDTGILEILKAYHDCGFEGYIRPDHGRHLWNEGPGNVRPGYGLYDRALGIMYMLGVWDMLDKLAGK